MFNENLAVLSEKNVILENKYPNPIKLQMLQMHL